MIADKPYAIDRIDNKGNIRSHLTLDGERTICGLGLAMNQAYANNGSCKRCDRIAADRAARIAAADARPAHAPGEE